VTPLDVDHTRTCGERFIGRATLFLTLALAACGGNVQGGDLAQAVDMGLPLCSAIQPPNDYPTGPCSAGALCTHPVPEGWSCDCRGADMNWSCNYIGQPPDLAR
jgi:hypothetical protein